MSSYTIQTESFEGPLDLLLQLIEKQELDITTVSLAQVTDQYAAYIDEMKELPPEEIADYLLILARLLYLKSKVLLPVLDLEDEEGVDLEKQLKLYKSFLEASTKIEKRFSGSAHSFAHSSVPVEVEYDFVPPENVTSSKLALYYEYVLKKMQPLVYLPKKIIERVVHISDKIQYITALFAKQSSARFSDLIEDSQNKTEKIVSFLAMLELVKQRSIAARQEGLFDEIELTKNS